MSGNTAEAVFRQLDTDDSGTIEKDELAEFLRGMGAFDAESEASLQQELDAIWQQLDENGDGCITLEEFERAFNELGLGEILAQSPGLPKSPRRSLFADEQVFGDIHEAEHGPTKLDQARDEVLRQTSRGSATANGSRQGSGSNVLGAVSLQSDDKMQQLRKLFDLVDEDNSGTIDVTELTRLLEDESLLQGADPRSRALRSTLGARQLSSEHVQCVMQNLDASGDGSLDFNEFVVAMKDLIDDAGNKRALPSLQSAEIMALRQTIQAQGEQIEALESARRQLQASLDAKDEALRGTMAEAQEQAQQVIDQAESQIQTLQEANAELRRNLASAMQGKDAAEEEAGQLRRMLDSSKRVGSSASLAADEVKRLELENAALLRELEELKGELGNSSALQSAIGVLEDDVKKHNQLLSDARAVAAEADELDGHSRDANAAGGPPLSQELTIDELRREILRLRELLAKSEDERQQLIDSHDELQATATEHSHAQAAVTAELAATQQELRDLQQQTEQAWAMHKAQAESEKAELAEELRQARGVNVAVGGDTKMDTKDKDELAHASTAALQARLEAAEEELRRTKTINMTQAAQMAVMGTEDTRQLQLDLDYHKQLLLESEQRISQLVSQADDLRAELDAERNQSQGHTAASGRETEALQQQLSSLQTRMASMASAQDEDASQLDAQMAALETQNRELAAQVAVQERELGSLRRQYDDSQTSHQTLEAANGKLRAELDGLTGELASLQALLDASEREQAAMAGTVRQLEGTQARLETQLEGERARLASALEANDRLRAAQQAAADNEPLYEEIRPQPVVETAATARSAPGGSEGELQERLVEACAEIARMTILLDGMRDREQQRQGVIDELMRQVQDGAKATHHRSDEVERLETELLHTTQELNDALRTIDRMQALACVQTTVRTERVHTRQRRGDGAVVPLDKSEEFESITWFADEEVKDIKTTPFTREEDRILIQGQLALGDQWTEIAKALPGRPDKAVAERWQQLTAPHRRSAPPPARSGSGRHMHHHAAGAAVDLTDVQLEDGDAANRMRLDTGSTSSSTTNNNNGLPIPDRNAPSHDSFPPRAQHQAPAGAVIPTDVNGGQEVEEQHYITHLPTHLGVQPRDVRLGSVGAKGDFRVRTDTNVSAMSGMSGASSSNYSWGTRLQQVALGAGVGASGGGPRSLGSHQRTPAGASMPSASIDYTGDPQSAVRSMHAHHPHADLDGHHQYRSASQHGPSGDGFERTASISSQGSAALVYHIEQAPSIRRAVNMNIGAGREIPV